MDFIVHGCCEETGCTYVRRIRHRRDRMLELDDDFEPSCDDDTDTLVGCAVRDPVVHTDEELPVVNGKYVVSGGALSSHGLSWYTVVMWLRHVRAPRRLAELAALNRALWDPTATESREALMASDPLLRTVRKWADPETVRRGFAADPLVSAAAYAFERGVSLRADDQFRRTWSLSFEGHPRADALRKARLQPVRLPQRLRTDKDAAQAAFRTADALVAVPAPCGVVAFCLAFLTICPAATVVVARGAHVEGLGRHRNYARTDTAQELECALYVTDGPLVDNVLEKAQKTVVVTTAPAEDLVRDYGALPVMPPLAQCAAWLRAFDRRPEEHRCSGVAGYSTRGVRLHFPECCRCDAAAIRAAVDLVIDDPPAPKLRVPFGMVVTRVAATHSPRAMAILRRTTFVLCDVFAGTETPIIPVAKKI